MSRRKARGKARRKARGKGAVFAASRVTAATVYKNCAKVVEAKIL
ncbi:hypothetical protein [Kosakonia sacchari]|nr:hypothetical protein [Kosakonia sacchari]